MEKTIKISGTDVKLKCTARTPIIYRELFGSDMFHDFEKIQGIEGAGSQFGQMSGGMDAVNKVAYVMAKHADPEIPEFGDWLDQFDMMGIMAALGDIIQLWGANMGTTSVSKKKAGA